MNKLLLLATVLVAACTSQSTATFSTATDDQLGTVLLAATSHTPDQRVNELTGRAGQNDPTGCPRIVTTGGTTTVTGGCHTEDLSVSGSIVMTNVPGSATYDANAPTAISADRFVADSSITLPLGLDGTYAVNPADGTRDLDVTTMFKDTVTTRLHLACEAGDMCTAGDGSSVELRGFGAAEVEGRWHIGGSISGTITLHGSDDIVFDLAATAGESGTTCFAYHLSDGGDGSLCSRQFGDL
jgi:hypothetical protein